MAPPSPKIIPFRSRLNGRQVSGATTRIASQAFKKPKLNGASLPPVMPTPHGPRAPSRTPGQLHGSKKNRP